MTEIVVASACRVACLRYDSASDFSQKAVMAGINPDTPIPSEIKLHQKSRRLELIYDDLNLLMGKFHPEAMSIEKLFYNTNAKTVIDVAQARGVTVLAAKKNNIPIFEYTPLQVKQSVVGYGRAEKKQVQEMTRIILKLAKIPKPDDTADALAAAICHGHSADTRKMLREIKLK